MNPEFPQNERARMEVRLTALLLGELHADEIAKLSKAMEADPELAALYERLKVTVELVREMKPAAEEPAPLKMSAEKREKLLASFKTVAPQEFARPRRVWDWLAPMAAVATIAFFFGYLLIPNFLRGRQTARSNSIINNLRLVNGAKQQWALENHKPDDAEPTMEDLKQYLGRGGQEGLGSVAGEKYVPGKVSEAPKVEASVSQARKMFGPQVVSRGEVRDGKVVISPLETGVISEDASDNYRFYMDLNRKGREQVNGTVPKEQPAPVASPARVIAFAPRLAPHLASTTSPTIVLPAKQEADKGGGPGQTFALSGEQIPIQYQSSADISEALNKLSGQQTNALADNSWGIDMPKGVRQAVTPGVVYTTNYSDRELLALNHDQRDANTSDRASSQLGAAVIQNQSLDRAVLESLPSANSDNSTSNVVASLNGASFSGYIDTSVPWYFGAAGEREDRPLEQAFRSSPTVVAQNGDFRTVLTRDDLNGLRYLATNGTEVTSQPIAANALQWSSFDGTTNPVVTGYNLRVTGPNTYGEGKVVNNGTLNLAVTTNDPAWRGTLEDTAAGNSSTFVARQAYVAPPSVNDGLLTSGLRNPAHVGGIVQAETPKSEIVLPEMTALMDVGVTDESGREVPRKPARPASGGKQVELAAAANARVRSGADQSRLPALTPTLGGKFAEVNSNDSRQLAFDWYLREIQNGAVTASGGSVPETQATIHTFNGGIPITGQLPLPRSVVHASSSTDSWTGVAATVRGFYDDNLNSKSVSSNRIAQYATANEDLDRAKKWREALELKTQQEQADVSLPKARMVVIMNPATSADTNAGFGAKIKETLTGKVERTASIQVDQERPDINVNGVQGNIRSGYDPYFLLTEFQTIQSQPVLSRVSEKLDLKNVWGKKYNNGKPMAEADVEKRIKSRLDLQNVRNTKVIEIKAFGDNAEDAAKLANQVAESYRDFRSQQYDELKHAGVNNLQQQLQAQDQKIAAAQARVDELRKSLGVSQSAAGAPISAVQEKDNALPKPAVPPPTPQPEILTRENAFSTFSLNVSDVSFKLAAAALEKGQMPEPASIRSEEFINAFDYRDPDAAPGVPVAFASERARYPFAHNRELLRFSLKTAAAGRQAGRPLNIVLLLDNSGSMERADRVSIIREALRVLAGQLHAGDTFSIVTFARTAQLRVDGIPGDQAGAAAEKIAELTPEGGTNLGDALDLAYETARHHYLANGDNRVVLLTDGAANLGDVDADTLQKKVEAQRQQGIALDCFGIGWEGYNDDLLEVLTRHGDGRYGFINSPEEANTEFVAQIAGALHVAAADVKVQVEFNPARVTSYRQIGYAKHQLTKEQFRDNKVDAAEIAAQEAGNALYTIETNPEGSGSIATVRVRYKVPATAEYREQAWDVPYTGTAVALDQASPAMRLAATACAFSEWLATSPFASEVSTDQLLRYMNGVPQFYGADGRPAKLEWMIRQAKSISGK